MPTVRALKQVSSSLISIGKQIGVARVATESFFPMSFDNLDDRHALIVITKTTRRMK